MNYRVPDFEMNDDYASPSVSRPRKATLEDDGIMELLWQNGQVVMQSQKSIKKSAAAYSDFADEFIRADDSGRREIHDQSNQQQQQGQQQQNLFMQEDEMASWLNYPLNDAAFVNDFCSDFLYSSAPPCVNATATEMEAPTTTATTAATAIATASPVRADRPAAQGKAKVAQRPPIPPPSRRVDNFGYWSSLSSKARVDESGPSSSNRAVVDSNETPAVPPQSRISEAANSEISARGTTASLAATAAAASSSGAGTEIAACEMTLTSSPSASSASAEPMTAKRPPPPQAPPPPEDRKRKGRELDDADCNSEDIELDSPDGKKHVRGSISIKKSRAAEVHNLSERRRRDRINEKMKALQELIPHCNKADKASMLDEAIEYLKSLQLQAQMMSMGCRMVPMMFPGVQQYMPHPHLAAMSMGMGMGMGMNRPMMPFPGVIPTAAGGGPHPVPRFPMPPPFHKMQQHSAGADPSRIPPNTNSHHHHPADSMMGGSFVMQNHPNHPHIPNFVDPYQQYLRLHHMQFPPHQNQSVEHGDSSKCSASKGGAAAENLQNHPSG